MWVTWCKPFLIESRLQNHRNREDDEGDVRKDVQDTGSEELRVALSALRTWVRNNLPIVKEWLAGGQVTNYCSDEGGRKENVEVTE